MKAIIYARVSTDRQDYQRQIEDLTKVVLADGFTEDELFIFSDKISGTKKTEEREGLTALIELCNTEKVDRVYVWEVSRLFRNAGLTIKLIEYFTAKKIPVYDRYRVNQNLNEDGSENAVGKLTLTIMAGVAEMELATTKARTKSGRLSSAKAGKFNGGLVTPYGYTKDVNKVLIVDEKEASIVKKMFELSLDGYGINKIKDYLNANNIPTKFASIENERTVKVRGSRKEKSTSSFIWTDGAVYTILTSELYIGKRYFKDLLVGIPPIITEDVFVECQKKLTGRRTNAKRNEKYDYLFRSKIRCGMCGAKYYPINRTDGTDFFFSCYNRKQFKNCSNKGISIPQLESAVTAMILNADYFNYVNVNKESSIEELKQHIITSRLLIDTTNTKVEKLKKEKVKTVRSFNNEEIDRETYNEIILEVDNEITTQESLIIKYNAEIDNYKARIEILSNVSFNIDNMNDLITNRAKLIQSIEAVLNNVVVYNLNNTSEFLIIVDLIPITTLGSYSMQESTLYAIFKKKSKKLKLLNNYLNESYLKNPEFDENDIDEYMSKPENYSAGFAFNRYNCKVVMGELCLDGVYVELEFNHLSKPHFIYTPDSPACNAGKTNRKKATTAERLNYKSGTHKSPPILNN